VASFCTLTDLQHGQDLEGAPDLPLCVDPGSKEFMDAAGYVDLPLLLSQASGTKSTSCPSGKDGTGLHDTLVHGKVLPAKSSDPVPMVASLTGRGQLGSQGQYLLPHYRDSTCDHC
jgi:hypothetical protein